MGRGASKASGSSKGGGDLGNATKKPTITEVKADSLKAGDVISSSDEKWSISINNETVRGPVNTYITVDDVKVSGKTVKISGHYDHSGFFPVGSKQYEEGKKRVTKVTKVAKKDTSFKVKR